MLSQNRPYQGRTRPQHRALAASSAAALLMAGASPAFADFTLFNDDFSDGDRSSPAWYMVQTDGSPGANLNVASVNGNDALQMDVFGGVAGTRAAVAHFNDVTLANTGDYLALSFDASVPNQEHRFDRKFVFGLYDTAGTPVTSDIVREEPDEEDDFYDADGAGYVVKADYGRHGGTSGGIFRQRVESRVFSTNSGLDAFDPATSDGESDVIEALRTFTLQITRLAGEDLQLIYSVEDQELINTTVSSKEIMGTSLTPDTYTFGMLAIGLDAPSEPMILNIDNVTVTSNVPEPTAAVALAAGSLCLLRRRRRLQ